MAEDQPQVVIWTDGSCLSREDGRGAGGWSAVIRFREREKTIGGVEADTTSERMELKAAVEALSSIPFSAFVTLYTDSRWLQESITKGRLQEWAAIRFQGVRHADLWQQMLLLLAKHTLQIEWVKGHAGNGLNPQADRLAKQQSRSIHIPQAKQTKSASTRQEKKKLTDRSSLN